MSARELVALGTASQVPTRARNHHAAILRWDDEVLLFDPGEGTQRQLTFAGISPATVTRICITHFHGDHCLGLPGIVQRLSLDGVERPVHLYFPASGAEYVDRLRRASIFHDRTDLHCHPIETDGVVDVCHAFSIVARRLDHKVDAIGYQLIEPDGRRMLPERLHARGISGPDVGRLQREGRVDRDGTIVTAEEVSEPRPGQRFAFVMDTRVCDAAVALADRADLLVCEATFLDRDAHLAREYGHMTARDAAGVAREAGARRLVLTHFSQRYVDVAEHLAEAAEVFPDVVAVTDLQRVAVPPRL